MVRAFNTTGPCRPHQHYMLPPEERLPELLDWVDRELYFVLHAARQTGKTTAMIAFAERLRSLGKAAVYVTLEDSQGVEDRERAEPIWVGLIRQAAAGQLPETQRPPASEAEPGVRLQGLLTRWAAALPDVPIVLLLDEADTISGDALISFLRQLRSGFATRGPGRFPVSIALIGMRDLRDYLTRAKDGVPVNPGSPFNIKKASLTLRNFTRSEIAELYGQHTSETGQAFTDEAVDRVYYWTQGQPFLVNALADACVGTARQLGDPRVEGTVTADHIDAAKERLILSRTTHLDSLSHRLRDARLAPILQAILLGDERIDVESDDYEFAVDLGLVQRGPDGAEIANPLYREVLARVLSYHEQMNLPAPWWPWRSASGGIDMAALMAAFQQWWRENSDLIRRDANKGYLEAVAHLAFMGFLQRVVNGGGKVYREYAAGRGRIDILVEYGGSRHAIELKRVRQRDSMETIRAQGITQLGRYLDTVGLDEGWLVIFDQRKRKGWDQRIWTEDVVSEGRTLHLVGG